MTKPTPQPWTKEQFVTRFFQLCQDYPTWKEAYESAERQHTALFGERKYSNYNSFRNVRDKKQNKNGISQVHASGG